MAVSITTTSAEPTAEDIGRIVDELEKSWAAVVTVKRTSKDDVGYRDIYVDLDGEQIAILHAGDEVTREVKPGHHRLKAHNTLFRKSIDMNLSPGEHATFNVVNKAGFGTYSVLAFFLGGGPLYLTLERETSHA
jgi:hypothetical protein